VICSDTARFHGFCQVPGSHAGEFNNGGDLDGVKIQFYADSGLIAFLRNGITDSLPRWAAICSHYVALVIGSVI
jgi:hypothetical protein